VTTTAVTRPRAVVREVPAGRRAGWWGMILFLLTDLAVFASMFASYFYLRFAGGGPWPPNGVEEPKLLKASIMTVLLLTSSGPMVFADLGIKKGSRRRLLVGTAVTILLGAAFLVVQSTEYREELRHDKPTSEAYGSIFYTITGWHGLHVFSGLLMLLFLLAAGAAGRITRQHHVRVRLIALFWHTVDAVWIVIMLCLYLSPRL
jgi:heme/copper-type cytochrome/quinol oxidase subunit 3